ncbi:MAG: chitobiase/beta-hexosaminidase C-terminal domain-containing protein [Duncaniella sp.]|nr:chitobiase/beta-hexosaminidase C-terminal domain-containing protein [Muribaculum sp.]MCM1255612.1 chitobiase/beta-hexosaminidase C-terminal domain-containing protein [Duncaniella sp.]
MKILMQKLACIVSILSAFICNAQENFHLVTDERQLDAISSYLIVANDYDRAASESITEKSKTYLSSANITKNPDNSLTVESNSKAHIYELRDIDFTTGGATVWCINDCINGGYYRLVTFNGNLGISDNITNGTQELTIKIKNNGVADIRFDVSSNKSMRYDSSLNGFVCRKQGDGSDISLYRSDRFDFKMDRTVSTGNKTVITSDWKRVAGYEDAITIYYLYNNGATPSFDLLLSSQAITPSSHTSFEIPRTGSANTLWLIAVVKPKKENQRILYSDIFKAELEHRTPQQTNASHFSLPPTSGYKLNEQVIIRHDSDVKIYYTLDGSTPQIPASGNSTIPPTYDIELTPIIYTGDPLSIKLIAVKTGYEPSSVVTLSITGESKPANSGNDPTTGNDPNPGTNPDPGTDPIAKTKTLLDEHFKKPADKSYTIDEEIIFLRDKDVKIYYTLDGSEPSLPDIVQMVPMGVHTYDLDKSPLYYKGKTLKINFIAIKEGYLQSDMLSVNIEGEQLKTQENVHFNVPADRQYKINETVVFTKNSDVKIYYTLDGSSPIIPDKYSPTVLATNTFDLDITPVIYRGNIINLKFVALKSGYAPSDIYSITIRGELKPTELNVHFWMPVNKYYAIDEIVIFNRDKDVKIYYTTDGTTPAVLDNTSSASSCHDLDLTPLVYKGTPITVKFIAQKAGYRASNVVTAVVTGASLQKTEINTHFYIHKEKGYKYKETVKFERLGKVKIYYTVDGSDPVIPNDGVTTPPTFDFDVTPLVYMGISISVKLIAIKDGLQPSDIISLTLTGEGVQRTTINEHFKRPVEKVYQLHESVIFLRDNDVKIYYTLDNQNPTIPDQHSRSGLSMDSEHFGKTYDLDQRPIYFEGESLTIKFVAVKQDYLPSEVIYYYIGDDASSIDSINPDRTDVESSSTYYNLNGQQVTPPLSPGVYILKLPNSATKILIP